MASEQRAAKRRALKPTVLWAYIDENGEIDVSSIRRTRREASSIIAVLGMRLVKLEVEEVPTRSTGWKHPRFPCGNVFARDVMEYCVLPPSHRGPHKFAHRHQRSIDGGCDTCGDPAL